MTWIAGQAKAIGGELDEDLALKDVWGLKLGSDNSREARSTPWVLNALSSFSGEVQARDLVRLLHTAARASSSEDAWHDRLLTPSAIKSALPECGKRKIEELKQENAPLGQALDVLARADSEHRRVPFDPAGVGLTNEQLGLLEAHGIAVEERPNDGYHLPEIYRRALDFRLARGRRPRVVNRPR